jgi:hypothetical protein
MNTDTQATLLIDLCSKGQLSDIIQLLQTTRFPTAAINIAIQTALLAGNINIAKFIAKQTNQDMWQDIQIETYIQQLKDRRNRIDQTLAILETEYRTINPLPVKVNTAILDKKAELASLQIKKPVYDQYGAFKLYEQLFSTVANALHTLEGNKRVIVSFIGEDKTR